MQTMITARHGDIPDDLRARTELVLSRLVKRAVRPTSAHVTFDSGRTGASAEIVLNAARNAVYVARADADDHRTALDRVAAKVQRQLMKKNGRPAARKAAAR
jgi:ribosomal subunit interface protein